MYVITRFFIKSVINKQFMSKNYEFHHINPKFLRQLEYNIVLDEKQNQQLPLVDYQKPHLQLH